MLLSPLRSMSGVVLAMSITQRKFRAQQLHRYEPSYVPKL
jgi:hypothetical protein